jgi:UrcA family protein
VAPVAGLQAKPADRSWKGTTMLKFLRLPCIALLGAAWSAGAVADASVTPLRRPAAYSSAAVEYRDLDLATEKGRAIFQKRIRRKAQRQCQRANLGGLLTAASRLECAREAEQSADEMRRRVTETALARSYPAARPDQAAVASVDPPRAAPGPTKP